MSPLHFQCGYFLLQEPDNVCDKPLHPECDKCFDCMIEDEDAMIVSINLLILIN